MIGRLAATLLTASFAVLFAAPAQSQDKGKEPQMTAEQKAEMEAYQKAGTPGPQHQALAASVGKYSIKSKSWTEPGSPAMEDSGTASRSMALDGRVLVEEVDCTMMGAPMTGRGMTGYDNVSGRYWSTWTDSMSTGIMVSQGTCDAKNSCTFKGTWNDPVTKGPKKARMTSRWTNPTTEVWEMHGLGKDGKEFKMMEITYTKM